MHILEVSRNARSLKEDGGPCTWWTPHPGPLSRRRAAQGDPTKAFLLPGHQCLGAALRRTTSVVEAFHQNTAARLKVVVFKVQARNTRMGIACCWRQAPVIKRVAAAARIVMTELNANKERIVVHVARLQPWGELQALTAGVPQRFGRGAATRRVVEVHLCRTAGLYSVKAEEFCVRCINQCVVAGAQACTRTFLCRVELRAGCGVARV